ncbi:MAG: acyl-CoA dehydrogenase C-terminal domain-containing protein [Acidimicrobiia bacterium]|nr:acyl-CoA dehydrogenase C-terminal domain-containing protein [Acidimicrobiia bacterium]
MTGYAAPLRDMMFALDNLVGLPDILGYEAFSDVDEDTARGLIDEAARFLEEVWAPTNQVGDEIGLRLEGDAVITPDAFGPAYQKLVDAGWPGFSQDAEYGGGGMPAALGAAVQEMMISANAALSMICGLTSGAADLIHAHGSDEQKNTYLPKMVTGEWSGTMNLTEPDAGSDVGALKTRAVRQEDGTYRITGTKIFISFGEHDLTDQKIHLVLARTPDAPPGTKGISCFIVPKFLLADDGSLGVRNDVKCVSIEHKMGIKASPTCVMAYGEESDGAIGYLIGDENAGMRYMFTMMNYARLAVGISGVAIAERAYQAALAYALERVQGRPLGSPAGTTATIVAHADVRRMLMTMKAYIEAMRAICFVNAAALDRAAFEPDPDKREEYQQFADLLTPITKAWSTDIGCDVASLGIQVFGGMGYIEEAGVSQFYRDLRICPIYEGTNGIQALDLIGRKLPMAGGQPVFRLIADMRAIDADLAGRGDDFEAIRTRLAAAVDAVESTTGWIMEHGLSDPNDAAAGATPYLRVWGFTLGAYYLAKSAIAADDLRASGDADDKAYLDAKVVTARFYADQLLPQAVALVPAVTSGKDVLYAIDPDHLA